ncbi:MAG: uncharacterized protein PWP08_49 [Methanofollis sp.]|nr:uncharacterized protein [Methanofollis sp.]
MRNRTRILCAALMVLLAAGVWSASAATDTTDERSIHVSGTGEITTTPDRAVISFAVETEDTDPKAAQAANAQIMDTLNTALKTAGIAAEDMKTTGYNIWTETPDDDKPFSSQKEIYHVTNTLQVTLTDVTKTGEMIDVAVANGANRVSSLYFTLSPEKTQQFRGEALTRAVGQARTDAETVAAAAGVTITGVQDISIGSTYVPVYDSYLKSESARAMGGGGAPTPIESGEVKVTASVSVTYLCR